jgi:hypothetical protein
LKSLPTRGAWIETKVKSSFTWCAYVAPNTGGVDWNVDETYSWPIDNEYELEDLFEEYKVSKNKGIL